MISSPECISSVRHDRDVVMLAYGRRPAYLRSRISKTLIFGFNLAHGWPHRAIAGRKLARDLRRCLVYQR